MQYDLVSSKIRTVDGDPFGSLALIACKPGQVWKEAAVAGESSAMMQSLGLPP